MTATLASSSFTTTLVHASGGWVSSDWPSHPYRDCLTTSMQRTLAYASSLRLFHLSDPRRGRCRCASFSGMEHVLTMDPSRTTPHAGDLHVDAPQPRAVYHISRKGGHVVERPQLPTLSSDASSTLCRQLVSELDQLSDPEALAGWAFRALPLKNQLLAADAQTVEGAFSVKLAQLERLCTTRGRSGFERP